MKPTILLLVAAFAFTACSRYDYYWHQEEDDVYFISQTPEEVDIYSAYRNDDDEDDDDYDTYEDNRPTPDYDPYPRTNRRNTVIFPRRNTTTYPRTTQPRTSSPKSPSPKTSPAPRRPSRPRPGSTPKGNPK